MQTVNLKRIHEVAVSLIQPAEENLDREFQSKMEILLQRPKAKTFLIQMLDVAFRSQSPQVTAGYIHWLFQSNSAYRHLFSYTETALLRLFQIFGRHVPSVSIPIMLQQIQNMTQGVVFFEGEESFLQHAHKRTSEGVTLNINLIGEALIGEKEAQARIQHYKDLLHREEIDYVSIKMSTIYSQIHPLAFDHNVKELKLRLSDLYRVIQTIQRNTGRTKFINIDMEEYRDLWLNIQVFTETLDQSEFQDLSAGIVLQAYLPDSYQALQELKAWAQVRRKQGGSPIKIRLVKGANLEMEQTESALKMWPAVTFSSKKETDANYKKILDELLTPESLKMIHVGVASHNIFDISYALIQVHDLKAYDQVSFEILEGMAPELSSHLRKLGARLVIYTPLVERSNYNAAIAYLVRRLDEGTQKGNFLKEGFQLNYPSENWNLIWDQFTSSLSFMPQLDHSTRRTQDRNRSFRNALPLSQGIPSFENESDTDWSLLANRDWIKANMKEWKKGTWPFPQKIPLVFHNSFQSDHQVDQEAFECVHVQNYQGRSPWAYTLANHKAIQSFIDSSSAWQITPHQERYEIFIKAAHNIRNRRSQLIGAALLELGKQVEESDTEVSEAVDFANYYAQSILKLEADNFSYETQGVQLVLSPWNFPIAIPLGGVLASLAAGKRVILKPSLNATATAYVICQCLWEAGVPQQALAFLPAQEKEYERFLTSKSPFDAVILTGSTATAKHLLKQNPELPLYAETGGKNTTYIEALSDHEQAMTDLVQSSFSNAGQKCSASSLLLLQDELYHSETFKATLVDTVESLKIGSPWELDTRLGLLLEPVNQRIMNLLENTPDERWLLKPSILNDFQISPGILWDVEINDEYFQTEFFGPIIGVMPAKDVQDAVKKVNLGSFGLTSGIHTLHPPSIAYWLKHIQAGNLYVNRSTTGAIVQRQPFGGLKESSFGFGMKAGGPNYVLQFLNIQPDLNANGLEPTLQDIKVNYQNSWEQKFKRPCDRSRTRGQHNVHRYLKPQGVLLIKGPDAEGRPLEIIKQALEILDVSYHMVDAPEEEEVVDFISLHAIYFQDHYRIRAVGKIPIALLSVCHQKAIHIYRRPPHASGKVEFLNYLQEQSISENYHRYGNMMGVQPGDFNMDP